MNSETVDLKELAQKVHALAKDKGWHSFKETDEEFITRAVNNAHGEISELWESYRGNALNQQCDKAEKMDALGIKPLTRAEEECADIVIRDLDSCERMGVCFGSEPIGIFPRTTFPQAVRMLHGAAQQLGDFFREEWAHRNLLIHVSGVANMLGFDLLDAVERKHQYNATREYRHGGKVA